MKPLRCFLGVGGNLGQPGELFDSLPALLAQDPRATFRRESSRYRSAPVDATGPDYLNAVIELDWTGTPDGLLQWCMRVEMDLGRVRSYRNAPRPIDLDVLLMDQLVITTDTLSVPHPRMHLRRFVLEPLVELAPEVYIPGQGLAADLLSRTQDQTVIRI